MFRIAVVGAGPAGLSATSRLLKNGSIGCVNLFDRSLVPFGLLRTGVAPDHPEVKHTAETWSHVGSSDRFRFHGGVSVGRDTFSTSTSQPNQISLKELVNSHDAVLLANGAYQSRTLGLSNSSRVIPAQQIVGEYNADPYFTSQTNTAYGGRVGLVGGGNVALDVARLLLNYSHASVAASDIAHSFHASLRPTTEVHFFIRRSPFDLPCTTRELREMLTIPHVHVKISGLNGQQLHEMDEYKKLQKSRDLTQRKTKRLLKLLADKEIKDMTRQMSSESKLIKFHFHHKPTHIDETDNQQLAVMLESTTGSGSKKLQVDYLIESLGYQPTPVDNDIASIELETGRAKFNRDTTVYLAGWALSGARGVVGDSTESARVAVDSILSDLTEGRHRRRLDDRDFESQSNWSNWQTINTHELAVGQRLAKSREKVVSFEEMISLISSH